MGRGKDRRSLEPIAHPKTAQDYADLAHSCLTQAADNIIILVGEVLLEAKGKLEHGEWLRMFRDHDVPVERPLLFGARTAQMLMKIAEHPVLSDANHGSRLPTSWRTLYELTKVPEPVLEKALTDGRIHPGMERKHVPALRAREPALVKTDAATPAAREFERLRTEVLSRPEFARRWEQLRALEREEEALREKLSRVRDQARQERHRLTEDLQKTIEAEHGPIQFRSVVLAGKDVGREALLAVGDATLAFSVLPVNGAAKVDEVEEAPEKAPFICTSCEGRLHENEVIQVRECPQCEERFDGADGRNCPTCNRPFSRLITEQGYPDCLGDDGDVVKAELAMPVEAVAR